MSLDISELGGRVIEASPGTARSFVHPIGQSFRNHERQSPQKRKTIPEPPETTLCGLEVRVKFPHIVMETPGWVDLIDRPLGPAPGGVGKARAAMK